MTNVWRKFRSWPMWAQVLSWVVLAFIVIGVIAPAPEEEEVASVPETTETALETTTSQAPTTTHAPTTTQAPTTTAPPTTVPAEPVEVTNFSGGANTQTDDFTVEGTWQLVVETTGGAGLIVEILDQNGAVIDYVNYNPGTETSQFRQGCTCYLDIAVFGSTYNITVVDVP